jgi:hypothetical protein
VRIQAGMLEGGHRAQELEGVQACRPSSQIFDMMVDLFDSFFVGAGRVVVAR